jgi:hypothetical protein
MGDDGRFAPGCQLFRAIPADDGCNVDDRSLDGKVDTPIFDSET